MSHADSHDLRPLIEKKKGGHALSGPEIAHWVSGVVRDRFPNYQNSALLMAIVLKGMSLEETILLTREMARHGHSLPRPQGRRRIGKHSTGGVGDKTTFLLGPLLASYGVQVPFMSGRGLGHTGGTIDKLSGIQGMQTDLTPIRVQRILQKQGFCIFEQNRFFAPADSRIYALRDASGTVDSIPLIVSSILSKKLQEGLHGLLLDVKYGSGAFMVSLRHAKALGRRLLAVAQAIGLKTTVVYSAMDQPLGFAVGNNLEIRECLALMNGEGPRDLVQVCVRLAREMLHLAHPRKQLPSSSEIRRRLTSGEVLPYFLAGLRAQGAKAGAWERLPAAPAVHTFQATKNGRIRAIHARALGEAAMLLGAGRRALGDSVDPRVGIELMKKLGDRVGRGEPWAKLHAPRGELSARVLTLLREAFEVGRGSQKIPPRIAGVSRNFD